MMCAKVQWSGSQVHAPSVDDIGTDTDSSHVYGQLGPVFCRKEPRQIPEEYLCKIYPDLEDLATAVIGVGGNISTIKNYEIFWFPFFDRNRKCKCYTTR